MLYIRTYLRIELQDIEFSISNVACDNDAIILGSGLYNAIIQSYR